MKVEQFVRIYFDCDFPHLPKTPEWVEKRIEFFERYTLPSLKAQTFKKFTIVLLCGKTHQQITSKHKWDPQIRLSYNYGKNVFHESKADFIAITRIDSDDLFQTHAMEDVKNNLIFAENKRECLIFRHGITWDMVNRFLMPRFRTSPPFYTHIYPRVMFKDWPRFKADHYIGHGRAGGRLPETIELPLGRVVVTKSDWNVGLFRRDVKHPRMTDTERRSFLFKHPEAEGNKEKINQVLRNFAVKNAWEAYE